MTKDEVIKEIEENIRDIDKCISEDEDYIRGWKSALLVALELMTKLNEIECKDCVYGERCPCLWSYSCAACLTIRKKKEN